MIYPNGYNLTPLTLKRIMKILGVVCHHHGAHFMAVHPRRDAPLGGDLPVRGGLWIAGKLGRRTQERSVQKCGHVHHAYETRGEPSEKLVPESLNSLQAVGPVAGQCSMSPEAHLVCVHAQD